MRLKRVGIFLLSISIVSSPFAGCAKKDPATPEPTPQETSQPKEKELVTITIMKPGDPGETKIAQSVTKKIEDKLKLKIEYEYAPSANYDERVQIAMASGKLPDVIRFMDVNNTILKANVENGNIIDISPYIKDAPNLMKWTLPESWSAVKYKGGDKIYMAVVSTMVRADGLVVRQDWLEKLNIKLEPGKPVTIDQFSDIVKQFTLNDPDGNGINDTFGFNMYADASGEIVPLFTPFVLDVVSSAFGLTGWQKAEGELYEYMDPKLSQKSDKFKKFLDYLATLYKNKYVDPNYPSIKKAQADDNFSKGKVGMQSEFAGNVEVKAVRAKNVNPDAKVTWISGIINPEAGKVTGTSYSNGAYGGFAITKSSKNPERVIEFFDYQLSDEMYPDVSVYGGEGVGFTLQNGKRIPTDIYKDTTPLVGGMGAFPMMRRAKDANTFLKLTLDDATRAITEGWLNTSVENVVISKDMGYLPKAALDPRFLDYKKKMVEAVTKIALGLQPSSSYDAVLADWYKNGGEAYVKEMNEYIKSLENK